jgi:ABC-type nitrate/sulfonate/bicarbonate transport system permease component
MKFAGCLPLLGLALAWEGFARSGLVTAFMLPPLSAVLERIWADAAEGGLAVQLGATLYRAGLGFLIAALAGIGLGLGICRSRIIRWFFDPLISIGFPMPKIAFLPIVILWFGFYDLSKISMIVFDAVFPVVTATIAGAQGVPREFLWSARNLGAGEGDLWRQIVIPAALPQILTGVQVALPIALIVCIITEMKMGGSGLGGAMMETSRFADSPGVFAGIVEIGAVGYALVKVMAALRAKLLHWHPEALR